MNKNLIKTILRGIGQVMLQNNALTGLIFLAGIFYNSWLFGLGALFGDIVSTATAKLLKYSKEDIENGLYGANGTLVGIAIWFFFGFSWVTVVATILGSALSTVITHELNKKVPALTAPFVISTWIVILGFKLTHLTPLLASTIPTATSPDLLSATSMGVGQVMFQGNIITGLIFLLAILVNSRTATGYVLYGALGGSLLALAFSLPLSMINIGLFGYNAVLCGIALGDKKWSGFLLATLAIILSVLLTYGFSKTSVPALTAPFVLATWGVLLIKNLYK